MIINPTQLKFRAENKDIFDAILDGSKKVETRAASSKFKNLQVGDRVVLVCGKEKKEKTIRNIKHFKTVDEMLKVYKVSDIHPKLKTDKELINLYKSWAGNFEKIQKLGIIAMEFK